MFIEPHSHCAPSSCCSDCSIKEIIDLKIKLGYDGLILTNHIQQWYFDKLTYDEQIDRIVNDYKIGKSYGNQFGFKVFFGVEITLFKPLYADYLIYGVDEQFLRKIGNPCNLSVEELYEIVKENNLIMIQAHPLRNPIIFADPNFVDGYELNVCNNFDFDYKDEVIKRCKNYNKIMTCGSDYHGRVTFKNGGIILDDSINTNEQLLNAIRNNQFSIKY